MTNELIELLEKNAGEGNTPIRQAVTMLRQQAKELTDDEINDLWLVTCSKAGEVEDMQLHFARAILKKAQEK